MVARIRTKGDIHKIPEITSSIRLDHIHQIFTPITSDDQCPMSILIEGHPGIGKTTLAKEICLQWANNKLLTSDKLLLLLMLRDPNLQKITSTEELLKYTIPADQVKPVLNYLHTTNGAEVTFVIDGFDELSNELRHTSFFRKLIEGDTLPNARVVVTSRPSASACLHQHVNRRVKVLGFERSSKEQYVNDALKDSPSNLKTLKRHFQQYPNIDAICYIPLNMAIIVFLCLLGSLPPTATEMFASFILHTVCRHLKRTWKIAEEEHINKMEHLPQPIQQALQQLQKVAFDGLVEDKIVFSMDDLPDMCRDDPTCYGLLQSVECYCSDEIGTPTKSFNFLHLGIQEYFAAKYVATLLEDKVLKLLKESFLVTDDPNPNSKSVRLSNMWIMYCGITIGQSNSLIRYLSRRTLLSTFRPSKLFRWRLAHHQASTTLGMHPSRSTPCSDMDYFCRDSYFLPDNSSPLSCQCGCTHTDGDCNERYHIADENVPLLSDDNDSVPSDYEISCSCHPPPSSTPMVSHWSDSVQSSISPPSLTPPTQPVKYLSRGQRIKSFFQRLTHRHQLQQGYHPSNCSNTQVTSKEMIAPLQQGSISEQEISNTLTTISQGILKDPLKVLYLFQCFQEAQDDKLCNILSKSFDNDEIYLRWHSLLPHQVVSLGFFLSRSHRKWRVLHLGIGKIGDHGLNLLHHYLCEEKSGSLEITTVDLCNNNLTGASSLLLCDIITHLQLHTLYLDFNNITSVRDISTTVTYTKTVKVLDMQSNDLTAQEALAISDMMTCLEKLYISVNKLGDDGAVILSKGITKSYTLRELHIAKNNITATGATAIAKSLLPNISLKVLDMSENDVGDDGAIEISHAISNNKTLKNLQIYDCKITATGAVAIANSLLHNNSMEVLRLNNNAIGLDGATAIGDTITMNKTLKMLSLCGWKDTIFSVGSEVYKEPTMVIMRSLHHNNTITRLYLPRGVQRDDSGKIICDKTSWYKNVVKREVKIINSKRKKCNISELYVRFH
ncbi:protein NLRC3-like isoform X2 [Dysidea avara]